MSTEVVAVAPGRVNLIGDHTDYTGGLCLPMAIDLATTVHGVRGGDRVVLRSADEPFRADVPLEVDDPSTVGPFWARYVAGVVAVVRPREGLTGMVTTTVPIGAGLSSSAALEVSLALALGFEGTPLELAQTCQRAEQLACGVPTGILDQLASASGRADHAMVLDCRALTVQHVSVPDDVEIVVVHSGQERQLAASGYTERVQQCRAAEAIVGPLREATLDAVAGIGDPVLRARAHHVVTENQRVRDFAAALASGDRRGAGALVTESHVSLRDDYATSHPVVDALVDSLLARRGVLGARITGGGFGGCVVALTEPGALTGEGWHVRPAAGAHLR